MESIQARNRPNSGHVLNSAIEAIGNTPLIRLDRIAKAHGLKCNLCACSVTFKRWVTDHFIDGKVEFFNPGESVKDRMALNMIEEAEKAGTLVPGKSTLVEPTAGNTGVGLALIAILKVRSLAFD